MIEGEKESTFKDESTETGEITIEAFERLLDLLTQDEIYELCGVAWRPKENVCDKEEKSRFLEFLAQWKSDGFKPEVWIQIHGLHP